MSQIPLEFKKIVLHVLKKFSTRILVWLNNEVFIRTYSVWTLLRMYVSQINHYCKRYFTNRGICFLRVVYLKGDGGGNDFQRCLVGAGDPPPTPTGGHLNQLLFSSVWYNINPSNGFRTNNVKIVEIFLYY